MDENMNPDLTTENENAETVNESSEFKSFLNQQSSLPTDDSSTDLAMPATDEAVNDNPVKTKKGKGSVVALVLIIVLLVAATAGLVYFILNSKSTKKLDLDKTVLTVGDVENSAAEYFQVYSYYYAYAMYYQYTEEQVKELAQQQLVFVDTLYSEALKAGYTLSDEDKETIESDMQSVADDAESASMTVDEYLSKSICKGYTIEMLRSYVEKQYLAQKYYTDNEEAIQKKYEGSDALALLENEYKANASDYDMPDVSYWYFDASEDGAQAKADEIVAAVKGGTAFADAVKNVTGQKDAKPNDINSFTYSQLSANFAKDAADWIFKTNADGTYANGKGAVTSIDVNGVIYVIYVNNAPARDDSLPATVDYIQVSVSTDTSVKSEDELKLAAKASATKILKEFTDGDTSIAMFKKLSASYDNNDDELVEGDVFEDITSGSSVDSAVLDWAFAEGRKVGDYALVEGDGCFYILFFTSQAETPLWQQTVRNSLYSADLEEWSKNIEDINKDNIVANEDEIAKIVAFVAQSANNA